MSSLYPAAERAKLVPVRRAFVLALVLACVPLSDASAAGPAQWATVNLCDTASAPDSMGVRASMSGTGRSRRLYMRFRAQYNVPGGQGWRLVRGSGFSPWLPVGLLRRGTRQAGWTFAFDPPGDGRTFLVRGLVDFQWRAKRRRGSRKRTRWVVVKRRRAVTRAGLRGVDGGDPPGTSRASCLIS